MKVKCEKSSHCKIKCKHNGEHEVVVAGRFSNCKIRYCDYLKQAVHYVEV